MTTQLAPKCPLCGNEMESYSKTPFEDSARWWCNKDTCALAFKDTRLESLNSRPDLLRIKELEAELQKLKSILSDPAAWPWPTSND